MHLSTSPATPRARARTNLRRAAGDAGVLARFCTGTLRLALALSAGAPGAAAQQWMVRRVGAVQAPQVVMEDIALRCVVGLDQGKGGTWHLQIRIAGSGAQERSGKRRLAGTEGAFEQDAVRIVVSTDLATRWTDSDEVAIEASQAVGPDLDLHLLIEKDFHCFHRSAEQDPEAYPNPLQTGTAS